MWGLLEQSFLAHGLARIWLPMLSRAVLVIRAGHPELLVSERMLHSPPAKGWVAMEHNVERELKCAAHRIVVSQTNTQVPKKRTDFTVGSSYEEEPAFQICQVLQRGSPCGVSEKERTHSCGFNLLGLLDVGLTDGEELVRQALLLDAGKRLCTSVDVELAHGVATGDESGGRGIAASTCVHVSGDLLRGRSDLLKLGLHG